MKTIQKVRDKVGKIKRNINVQQSFSRFSIPATPTTATRLVCRQSLS